MARDKSDELFELIKSLNASEKRYFAQFSQRHIVGDENHYAWLFEVMAKSEAYEPDNLPFLMAEKGIETSLPAAKNHLKKMLFRALREFNNGRDTHTRLLEGLGNLAFLYGKKQYGLLGKEITRLKKLATLHNEHHILFKIGDYERRMYKETAKKDILSGMESILSEMHGVAGDFQNQMEFTHLLDRVYVLAKSGNKTGVDELNQLLSHPLLQSPDNAQTLFSHIYYHQIHAIIYHIRGELQRARAHYAAIVEIWEKAPHMIAEWPSTYRRILGNYLGIGHLINSWDDFPHILDLIRKSPSRTPSDEAEIFNTGYYYEMLGWMGTHEWERVRMILPAIQTGLERYGGLMDQGRILAFRYNAAIYSLLNQDISECRKWLREMDEGPRTEFRSDLQPLARALGLLVTWQTGDLDLLEYQLRAAHRFFEKNEPSVLIKHILRMIQNLLGAKDQTDKMAAFSEFSTSLDTMDLSQTTGGMELNAWVKAQIVGGKPLDWIGKLDVNRE